MDDKTPKPHNASIIARKDLSVLMQVGEMRLEVHLTPAHAIGLGEFLIDSAVAILQPVATATTSPTMEIPPCQTVQ